MLRAAGVTVLYNPGKELLRNIESYKDQLEILYLIDNSEQNKSYDFVAGSANIRLLPNNVNIGIAAALNKAAEQATNDGFDLFLTMDQDSSISANYVSAMVKEFEKDEKLSVLSPFIVHIKNPKTTGKTGIEEVTAAMTSGSVIRLSAHSKIGGFMENLFIDYVDHEYCLRMKSAGFKVSLLNSAVLSHNLGDVKERNFIFKKVFPTNHLPLRLYYRTRNRFYVQKTYKKNFTEYVRKDRIQFIKELIKILLYENKKLNKLKMIIKGYSDYRKGKFGKFAENTKS